jgi:hypothetical protein
MTGAKCPNCGIVNLATDNSCRRCHAPIHRPGGEIVLEDGYVLPPPPKIGLGGEGVWRDGSVLVMRREAELPDRCVKCNEPADLPKLKRKLTWHHPALYLIIFVALLVYAIIAMVIRQTATVEIGLCELHRARRKQNILITIAALLLSVTAFAVSINMLDGMYALAGLALLLGGTIYGIVTIRVITPSKIDRSFVWIRGISAEYLSLLPQWPGLPPGIR